MRELLVHQLKKSRMTCFGVDRLSAGGENSHERPYNRRKQDEMSVRKRMSDV